MTLGWSTIFLDDMMLELSLEMWIEAIQGKTYQKYFPSSPIIKNEVAKDHKVCRAISNIWGKEVGKYVWSVWIG